MNCFQKKCSLAQPLISPCNKNGEGGGKNGKKQDSTPSIGNRIVSAFQFGNQLGYNGKCYEPCRDERLNYLCQKELGKHREFFTKAELSNFIHYSIADDLVNAQKAYDDQARYLTVQNGLYDLIEHKIIDHAKFQKTI
jgi:hypothetical protein